MALRRRASCCCIALQRHVPRAPRENRNLTPPQPAKVAPVLSHVPISSLSSRHPPRLAYNGVMRPKSGPNGERRCSSTRSRRMRTRFLTSRHLSANQNLPLQRACLTQRRFLSPHLRLSLSMSHHPTPLLRHHRQHCSPSRSSIRRNLKAQLLNLLLHCIPPVVCKTLPTPAKQNKAFRFPLNADSSVTGAGLSKVLLRLVFGVSTRQQAIDYLTRVCPTTNSASDLVQFELRCATTRV
jgi:hypothetical protein